MGGLIKYNIIPDKTEKEIMARRVYEFNRYLKSMCKSPNPNYYKLDERAINFLTELEYDHLIEEWSINVKTWDNIYQKWMDVFREWINNNKEKILNTLNSKIFEEDWEKYAKGTISAWEMEALCFYYHEHELANVNTFLYGFANFFDLSEDPEIDRVFYKGGKEIKMFKLYKICGTCIAKDKSKSTVTLLTTDGVVTVKFRKEYFSLFDKQISERQADGSKKIIEKSWFNRGNMIVVNGMRSGDNFISKKYASQGDVHQLYKIDKIFEDGSLTLKDSRYQGGIEEDV
jgi:DNA polymerase-3 subunit alpha